MSESSYYVAAGERLVKGKRNGEEITLRPKQLVIDTALQQAALWLFGGLPFHGGNLHQSRHYSRYLALQLKARMEGRGTPVYGLQSVYYRA